MAAVLFNLALVREQAHEFEEAEKFLMECCEIEETKVWNNLVLEKVHACQIPDCTTLSHIMTWNKIGEMRCARKQNASAKECFEKCLAMTRALVGEEHAATKQLLEMMDKL